MLGIARILGQLLRRPGEGVGIGQQERHRGIHRLVLSSTFQVGHGVAKPHAAEAGAASRQQLLDFSGEGISGRFVPQGLINHVGHLISNLFASAMQTLAHRRLGDSEQGRQLGCRYVLEVVEDEGLSRIGRQPLDSLEHDLTSFGSLEIAVGCLVTGEVRRGGIEDLPRRLTLAPIVPRTAAVLSNRPQPSRKPVRVLKAVKAEVSAHEHLLSNVAGCLEVTGTRHGDGEDRVLMTVDEAGERFVVAVEHGSNQRSDLLWRLGQRPVSPF